MLRAAAHAAVRDEEVSLTQRVPLAIALQSNNALDLKPLTFRQERLFVIRGLLLPEYIREPDVGFANAVGRGFSAEWFRVWFRVYFGFRV